MACAGRVPFSVIQSISFSAIRPSLDNLRARTHCRPQPTGKQEIQPHLLHSHPADGHKGRTLQWIFEDILIPFLVK